MCRVMHSVVSNKCRIESSSVPNQLPHVLTSVFLLWQPVASTSFCSSRCS